MLTKPLYILHHTQSCAKWENGHLSILALPFSGPHHQVLMAARFSTLLGTQPGVRGEGVVSALLWVSFHCFCLPSPFQHRGDTPDNESLPGEIGPVDKLRDFRPISFI